MRFSNLPDDKVGIEDRFLCFLEILIYLVWGGTQPADLPGNLPSLESESSLILLCPLLRYACIWEKKLNSNIYCGLLSTNTLSFYSFIAGPGQRMGAWGRAGKEIKVKVGVVSVRQGQRAKR